jgi:diguanylate cyclase (GGDEF)-like protein
VPTLVPPALHIPEPSAPGDAHGEAEDLRVLLHDALYDVVRAYGLTSAQLFLELQGEEREVVAGVPSTHGSPCLVVQTLGVDLGSAGRSLLVTAADRKQDLSAVGLLLTRLVATEIARQQAVSAARGALLIANRDPHTTLGNRRAWISALRIEAARGVRQKRPSAVVIVDLDGLKLVNDRWGHAAGDALIERAAHSLFSACRETDVLCRVGGDEFAMLAPDTGPEQVPALEARLRAVLDREGIAASLGTAVLRPGGDAHLAWHEADAAMYADKSARRSG